LVRTVAGTCGGRFILTVGQGYRPENVDHQADWFSLEVATVRPGPCQPRRPADLDRSHDRMLEVYCHRDGEEAQRRACPHLLAKDAAYAAWGPTGSAGATAESAATIDDDAFAELARDRFVIGPPYDVVGSPTAVRCANAVPPAVPRLLSARSGYVAHSRWQ